MTMVSDFSVIPAPAGVQPPIEVTHPSAAAAFVRSGDTSCRSHIKAPHKRYARFLAVLFLLVIGAHWGNPARAVTLPPSTAVPGGVAIVPLDVAGNPRPPVAHYNGKRVMVIEKDQRWHAVVGIPLDAAIGTHHIEVSDASARKQRIAFAVADKQYDIQRLTIKDKRKVDPLPQDLKRIDREKKRIDAAFARWSDTLADDLLFALPAQGEFSSPFGLRRFFNEQPRNPHSGLDIAAPIGTPIHAPANGVVIDTGNFFFNGNSVFIDHGQGLVTMFCHMDKISAKIGQKIKRGDFIGTVGATGRVTGAHLHWSVSLNNARVDPMLFLDQSKGL